ncbi:formylglycine-generating enzyme family protein [Puteibacter caeruleilacunae]|nr:formylglycine-generating enzyme family protein [Puteibacter caeruleilacunae]
MKFFIATLILLFAYQQGMSANASQPRWFDDFVTAFQKLEVKQIKLKNGKSSGNDRVIIDSLITVIREKYPESLSSEGLNVELAEGITTIKLKDNPLNALLNFYRKECLNCVKKPGNSSDQSKVYELRQAFVLSHRINKASERIKNLEFDAVKMAIKDCQTSFPEKYTKAEEYLASVKKLEKEKSELLGGLAQGNRSVLKDVEKYLATIDEALLANPLLDFNEIMFIKRDINQSRMRMPKQFGFPSLNSHNNTKIIPIQGDWHNTISLLSDIRGDKEISTVVNPKAKRLITDLELDFDADKMLYSSVNDGGLWHVYESGIKGKGITCLTPDSLPDVNHFDACYLPDGNIIYTSDATYQGLPCEGGSRPMAVMYLLDRKTGKIRQLTYEQDTDFCPVVLNNGRVLYLRWEYSDLAHYFSRILMSCNPDGTGQMEYYGSNSYFPNSYMYARPIPDNRTMLVGIVGGHHGISRSGRLILLDPKKGRSEAEGMVHEIPHRGRKVEAEIKDQLVRGVWPQFIHPYPLNDKYFLVSAKMNENALWGIYLVDVFNNMTLIKEVEGAGLFDPIPVKKQQRPPVILPKIKEGEKEATVFLTDIYVGDGLKNIPRGTVKSLRLFAYHYGHISTGGHHTVGVESSWDIKRVLGTVPVEKDGSALFKIPANTPIAIQPLDASGKALQLMRSWLVGMPGENVSCIGCHERTSQAPPNIHTLASRRAASKIKHWQGSPRPFSFRYEVQPVLDKYCLSCHNGQEKGRPDFRKSDLVDHKGKAKSQFFLEDKSYMSLHPFVRRPGPESDLHLLNPMEYNANTSELIQMLQRGHYGVEMSNEDWEKLYAWIDLNAPYRGKWSPPEFRNFDQDARRKCLNKRYANVTVDPEAEYDSLVAHLEHKKIEPVAPKKMKVENGSAVTIEGWPFSKSEAQSKQAKLNDKTVSFELGDGQRMTFTRIPEGKFVSRSKSGFGDEKNGGVKHVDESFYMGTCEVTNAQYALFDPTHDSRYIDQQWKDHTTPGYPANMPNQPVIRVSYDEAVAYCEWLSKKINRKVTLPTDIQWEWACRSGSDNDFWYGSGEEDFSKYENLADHEVRKFAVRGVNPRFIGDNNPSMKHYAFIPREESVNDGNMIVSEIAKYQANPWGLYDMHGNVAEWTRSSYKNGSKYQDNFYNADMKVVKGGSWRDRPKRSAATSKRYYYPYQKVYNVGFRVVIE